MYTSVDSWQTVQYGWIKCEIWKEVTGILGGGAVDPKYISSTNPASAMVPPQRRAMVPWPWGKTQATAFGENADLEEIQQVLLTRSRAIISGLFLHLFYKVPVYNYELLVIYVIYIYLLLENAWKCSISFEFALKLPLLNWQQPFCWQKSPSLRGK